MQRPTGRWGGSASSTTPPSRRRKRSARSTGWRSWTGTCTTGTARRRSFMGATRCSSARFTRRGGSSLVPGGRRSGGVPVRVSGIPSMRPLEGGGSTGADYALVFREVFVPALRRFDPDVVVVSAGQDALFDDPLGSIHLRPEGFGGTDRDARGRDPPCISRPRARRGVTAGRMRERSERSSPPSTEPASVPPAAGKRQAPVTSWRRMPVAGMPSRSDVDQVHLLPGRSDDHEPHLRSDPDDYGCSSPPRPCRRTGGLCRRSVPGKRCDAHGYEHGERYCLPLRDRPESPAHRRAA